jgi:hypothetical protein
MILMIDCGGWNNRQSKRNGRMIPVRPARGPRRGHDGRQHSPWPGRRPEREAQLERVEKLQRAWETGDLTGVDLTIHPPGYTGSPS